MLTNYQCSNYQLSTSLDIDASDKETPGTSTRKRKSNNNLTKDYIN